MKGRLVFSRRLAERVEALREELLALASCWGLMPEALRKELFAPARAASKVVRMPALVEDPAAWR